MTPREPGHDLSTVQRWLSHLVRHPRVAERAVHSRGAKAHIPAGALARREVILPSATMKPGERIDVYGNAYFARLGDVLREDFPGVAHALGPAAFVELANAYARNRPSRHPNLTFYGQRFPAFVDSRRRLPHRRFLRDLARLELALVEAFHAPRAEPLDLEAFAAGKTQEHWNDAVLHTHPSLRLVTARFPVNAYLQAVFDEASPSIPESCPTWVAVYRKDFSVWRTGLTKRGFATLAALAEGLPFGTALSRAAEEAESVGSWFRDWAADGLFVAESTPPRSS